MGDMFASVMDKWYKLEVGCSKSGFETESLTVLLEHTGAHLKKRIRPKHTEQTAILRLDTTGAKAPPLPSMADTSGYPTQIRPMSLTMRKNYIKDRTQEVVTYITEYSNTSLWKLENSIPTESLTQCLQIVFGRTNATREAVDKTLEIDDSHRSKCNMIYLMAPKCFPIPDTMDRHEPAT